MTALLQRARASASSLTWLAPHWWLSLLAGALLLWAGTGAVAPITQSMSVFFGQVLLCLGTLLAGAYWLTGGRVTHNLQVLISRSEQSTIPIIISDADHRILYINQSFKDIFSLKTGAYLRDILHNICIDPEIWETWRSKTATVKTPIKQVSLVTRRGTFQVSIKREWSGFHTLRFDHEIDALACDPEEGLVLPAVTVGQTGNIISMTPTCRSFLGEAQTAFEQQLPEILKSGEHQMITAAQGKVMCRILRRELPSGLHQIFLFPKETRHLTETENDWTFFSALPVPLLKISASGNIVLSNAPARDLLGVELSDAPLFSDILEGLGRSVSQWLQEAIEGRNTSRPEFLRVTDNKQERFVQVSLRCMPSKSDAFLIAVLNDATELKTLEAQFVQSQKMQAIGQLAGGVAHDFNNLLTAISGHCDLLLLRHDRGDPDHSDLLQIHQNANRAASLVGQLLAFSRKQTLCPEVIDLRDTLSDLTHLLNRLVGEKVFLELIYDPGLKSIRADKRQLKQVLMNLVVNARDAMPEGGEIKIRTETRHIRQDYTRDRVLVPAGSYVAVTVDDNGIGIPSDKLQKVFEPFFTTKRTGEGTGLGLSTAYGIIKQTGGFIFVDSAVGHGTEFTLLFPAYEPNDITPAQPEILVAPSSLAQQEEGLILLVEDEAPVRAFASRALQMKGYSVLEADSAEAALDLIDRETRPIDLFVTDVVMPGLDGPSWVRQALEKRPETKVVFVSGYAEEAFSDKQSRIPNSVFLPKPFSLKDLTQTVQNQMRAIS
jgi:two-component system cell cycle sensor histidine kinase/response regulator CckA